MSLKVSILEIVCIVHANDLLGDSVPLAYTCHCIGGYISNNMQYPIFVVMEAEKDARINNDKS